MNSKELLLQENKWQEFLNNYLAIPELQLTIEYSGMNLHESYGKRAKAMIDLALDEMDALERGAIANHDEGRQVGHYWLRSPNLAPSAEITSAIIRTNERIRNFAEKILKGEILGDSNQQFRAVVVIGIGGSALGPQFVNRALSSGMKGLSLHVVDNTDPDEIVQTLRVLPPLDRVLVIVTSKSGGTKETRNAMLLFQEAYRRIGLNPASYFVAVTLEGSDLNNLAKQESWLEIFPIWDWVGGRTSEFSAVGLLPAALSGVNTELLLAGASAMDVVTRRRDWLRNPAMVLALCWFHASSGKGNKAMIVLPYKDRLELFSRYLQQLVMESLGKEFDREGRVVEQGLTIFGNKGSTDQHAYVQQLRDGIDNFFVNFIQVKFESERKNQQDGLAPLGHYEVEKDVTSGDYLHGFLQGTKEALSEKGRQHFSVCLESVTEESIGSLIALYERAVGFYASFINVNAYHQPGVEAGKIAANEIIKLQRRILDYFRDNPQGASFTQLCLSSQIPNKIRCFHVVTHLVSTGRLKSSGDLSNPSSEIFFVPTQ